MVHPALKPLPDRLLFGTTVFAPRITRSKAMRPAKPQCRRQQTPSKSEIVLPCESSCLSLVYGCRFGVQRCVQLLVAANHRIQTIVLADTSARKLALLV